MHSVNRSVAVVIPVWDEYVRYLPEAVSSVQNEQLKCRILVVDNASTWTIPPLPGVDVVRSPERLSVGGARNLGLASLDCEYVVVLDVDDRILPGTLGFLCDRMDAEPSLGACVTSILDGETEMRHRSPRRLAFMLARWRGLFTFIECIWSLYPTQGCTMFRLKDAQAAGGYADSNFGEDWVLAVSLAFRGRVLFDSRLGLYYGHTEGSLWRRPRPASDLMQSARLVRARLRRDPAAPRWSRAMMPLIAVLQLSAVYVVRPFHLGVRRFAGWIAARIPAGDR